MAVFRQFASRIAFRAAVLMTALLFLATLLLCVWEKPVAEEEVDLLELSLEELLEIRVSSVTGVESDEITMGFDLSFGSTDKTLHHIDALA